MPTLAIAPASLTGRMSFAATANIFVKETKYEFLKLFRNKTFSLSVIGFPVMFYLLFGVANRGHMDGSVQVARYALAGYACFGMVGAALFGVGVGLASERAMGWLELKRASPMPALAYLLAKSLTAQAFGMIIVGVLILLAGMLAGVRLTLAEAALMLALAFVGTVPFAAMGLLVALLVPANAASGVVNLIYLPMSFMSGLWIPIQYLPKILQGIAPAMPTYHLSQLMLSIFGYQQPGSALTHWAGLLGFLLLMLGCSWIVFQRAEQDA